MNILVIGNGFDIAHGLPTTYMNFFNFIQDVQNYENSINYRKIETLRDKAICDFSKDEHFVSLIQDNIWLKHFQNQIKRLGKYWIDFETEISNVIQAIEIFNLDTSNPQTITFPVFHEYIISMDEKDIGRALQEKIEKDLDDLIEALEIYLRDYVNHIEINKKNNISELKINKVLSFNYTNTYARILGIEDDPKKEAKICHYIHGKAREHSENECNMVLGIDEYLPPEEQVKNTKYIKFKKYFQRINKETDGEYRKWIETIQEQNLVYTKKLLGYQKIKIALWFMKTFEKKKMRRPHKYYHNIYFLGHSLDTTDRDVIRGLILNDNVRTTIYYYNKEDYTKKIANLVKNVGEDELIKRAGGKYQTIFFENQNVLL